MFFNQFTENLKNLLILTCILFGIIIAFFIAVIPIIGMVYVDEFFIDKSNFYHVLLFSVGGFSLTILWWALLMAIYKLIDHQ